MTTDKPAPLTPEERIERGYATIHALCSGKLRWEMRVPAEPDHDPDLILVDALNAARELLDAERAGAARLRAAAERVAVEVMAMWQPMSADDYPSFYESLAILRADIDAEPGQPR